MALLLRENKAYEQVLCNTIMNLLDNIETTAERRRLYEENKSLFEREENQGEAEFNAGLEEYNSQMVFDITNFLNSVILYANTWPENVCECMESMAMNLSFNCRYDELIRDSICPKLLKKMEYSIRRPEKDRRNLRALLMCVGHRNLDKYVINRIAEYCHTEPYDYMYGKKGSIYLEGKWLTYGKRRRRRNYLKYTTYVLVNANNNLGE